MQNEFYRYYAGYPLNFAEWALGELGVPPGGLVIDPWNGSGTTAAACARLGISFHGYDINPVMVHLGRARVAPSADFAEARELVDTVEDIAKSKRLEFLAEFGSAFQEIPVGSESAHSVALAALFPLARQLLSSCKTKNPSWFKKGSDIKVVKLRLDDFVTNWRDLLRQIELWRSNPDDLDGVAVNRRRQARE